MRENKNGLVGPLFIAFFLISFALLIVGVGQAYSYSDYYDGDNEEWNEEWNNEEDVNELDDDDAVGYYDYAGQWHEIPEPDPYYPAMSYGHHRGRSPVGMTIPLFIFFFVFIPWLAYALGEEW